MSAWRMACADYSFPALTHPQVLRLVADLGFDGVDIGLFAGRGHVRPEDVVGQEVRAGKSLADAADDVGIVVADVFAQISDDFRVSSINDPDPGLRRSALDQLVRCMDVAVAAGSSGLTILPGVAHAGRPLADSFARSVDSLNELAVETDQRGLRLSFEAHVESLVPTPELALQLACACPGVGVTLDPGHFVWGGSTTSELGALIAYTQHVQFRGGATGVLQASLSASTIDLPWLVAELDAQDYDGWITAEYVHSPWHGCDKVDNLTETVALRNLLSELRGDTVAKGSP